MEMRSAEEEQEPNEDATVTVTVNDGVQTGDDGIGSKQSMGRTGGVERLRDVSMNDGDRSACNTETDDVAVTGTTVTNRGTPGNNEPGVTANNRHERDPKVTVSDRSTQGNDEELASTVASTRPLTRAAKRRAEAAARKDSQINWHATDHLRSERSGNGTLIT
ncbi:hypothetical protein PI124_g18565 [Phytophthora idaei]|nr:hypothetical protein PI125_g19345 [Phytophthora idaei]KAG3236422.1 hypothetical protein PI124_g18565 [Phytophthora idaei]